MKQVFKVVRESNYNVSALKIIDKLKSMDANYTVTEESEEPDIDFDALYKEYLGSVQFGSIPTAWQFRNFLKSKNLTQPQVDMDALRNEIYASIQKPVEIPVKKTWTLKKHVKEIFHDFGNTPYPLTSDPPYNLKKYYDLHEDPDYSKIPKGSIVVVCSKDDKIKSAEIVDFFDDSHIYCNGGISYELKHVKIRIVELAKENV